MGQNESKQRIHQITNGLERIRKDVRNGKITANDVERIQGILEKYSDDYEKLPKKDRKSEGVYPVLQLIEITSKELDALKQEVNLDLAAVPTDSFSRASSKKYAKEKRRSIKSIKEAVENIKQQIRSGQVKEEDHENLQRELVLYSQLLSGSKGKKQEIDSTQKMISSVTSELFNKQQQNNTNSLNRRSITPPLKRTEKRSSIKEKDVRREMPQLTSRISTSTLDDITNKLDTLKNDITVAENNKDKTRLRFISKSIETLMTDLQMVDVKNQILNEERKEVLESNLVRTHQQVEKVKRQISTQSNINYLADLEKKEQKENILQELVNIQKTLMTVSKNLSLQNYEAEKETFNKYKTQIESIEETDEEVKLKKAEVSDVIMNVDNAFTRLEMEYRLNQAEWRHCQYKMDLKDFPQTSESEKYRKHREYLLQLKDYVNKILEINTKIDEKKKYVLYNIENNIVALDKKAKDNEETVDKQEEGDVVLRSITNSKSSNKELFSKLLASCRDVSFSSQEMKDILPLLTEAKIMIEQKLNLFLQQGKKDEADAQLVTVKEKQLQSPMNKRGPSVSSQIDNIQKEVEALQIHIENSRYNKETQLYQDMKAKLENYKSEVTKLSTGRQGGGKSYESLLKYIDNVLLLLENNMSSRKSNTTEDILVDIMSISTRINELGSKIQGFGYTTQEYGSIEKNLLEHYQYLINLQIAPGRSNLSKSRDEVLRQIERHLSNLEDVKHNRDTSSESQEEKRFNQELRKLKEKVSRYSGTYKNVLYKTIENDLDKHFNNADKVFKDGNVALKVKREIENSKMILEQKSNKDQNYNQVKRDVRPSSGKELIEIRQNVDSVQRELSQMKPLTAEELDQLDARLTLSILALDNIKDHHSLERDRLYQDIKYYFAQIEELKFLPRSHPVLVENLKQQEMDEKEKPAQKLAAIESDLDKIKAEILTFVGSETSPEFLKLDEVLVRSTLALDEMNFDQADNLYQLKMKLMRDIHQYSDVLDERINQSEEFEKFEKDVKVMLMKIDSFNGYYGDSEYTSLDEQIIKLKVALGKLEVNQELSGRREACIKEIDSCMKKLNEAAKTSSGVLAGTLV